MICLRAVGTGPVELTLEIDPEAKPGCIDCECTILTVVYFVTKLIKYVCPREDFTNDSHF